MDSALARIGNAQHRQVFYSKLENPNWVSPLTEKGAFTDVPSVSVDDQGGMHFTPWPQGEYLARVAPLVPREVNAALQPALSSDSPVVQRIVIEAASRMPADYAAGLVPTIRSYLNGPYRVWLDATKLVAIVCRLAEGGKRRHAKQLADGLFRPRSANQSTDGLNAFSGVDSYWYAQTLPTAVKALEDEPKMLSTAVVWLEQWVKLTPHKTSFSSLWRPSIKSGENALRTEPVGHVLVDAVRDLARARITAGKSAKEVVEQIERGGESIFLRLSLDLITDLLPNQMVDQQAGTGAEPASTLLELAFKRLITPELLAGEYRPEYVDLARSALPYLSEEQASQWERLVIEPPHLTADRVGRMLGRPSGEVTGVEIASQIGMWQHRLLLAIGWEALPSQMRQRLDELVADHGAPPDPGDSQYQSGFFVGPISPLPDAELVNLSPEDLLAYLQSWEPSPESGSRHGFPPSAEGLARGVTKAVATRPAEYALCAERFSGLQSTYVAAALEGFEQAVAQKTGFSWGSVLALATHAATQPGNDADELGESDDDAWRYVQQQAARLIQAGIDADEMTAIPPTLYAMAWEALNPMTRNAHPSAHYEESYGLPSTDALTLSLNTTRPIALRATIRLFAAISRIGQAPESEAHKDPIGTQAEILAALDEHAGFDSDTSLAVAAVFGEGLGLLLTNAREWTTARLDRILGRPEDRNSSPADHLAWFDTAWSVMIVGYRPSRGLFDSLKPWFLGHIRGLDADTVEDSPVFGMRSPRQSLADHVLMLFVTGQLESGLEDQALTDLFAFGDSALLRDALGHLGWQLRHAEGEPPGTVLARFRELWDWRAQLVAQGAADSQELLDFYWWVSSGHLDAGWWLPHLATVAHNPQFNPHSMLGEPLAKAAPTYPDQVLEVYATLYVSSKQNFRSYDLLEHAPAILKPALTSGQEGLERSARALVEQLGNEGYLDLMNRIRALPE
ncbi:hypothetical protein ACFWPQ_51795 [Streptomyces sp. NPDC058464]|uniref:hypothetical protein n=1 Tax=Streptomyces sp. NPDC058464 TaxID=3346511 RepID=UPI0036609EC7